MAHDLGSGRRSASPESSGRDSPIPRQWRTQLSGGTEEAPIKDKSYKKYAYGVDRALVLFETALEEWADYISFLNRLLKALQARPKSITAIPAKATVAKRLSQCLNPSLPSGVHQKAIEVYAYVFSVIGNDGLSRDLPLYLPGLAPTLSFASLSVRSPYLDLLEKHFLRLDSRSLRPALKSIILALLPGLEDETSEDFDRTLRLVEGFKQAVRPAHTEALTERHSSGDQFFWQCFFLASITSQSRRFGALAYLARCLPTLASSATLSTASSDIGEEALKKAVAEIVTSPEPGLLLRCFASGLSDEQLLIQRGFLDLLVTHLPLNSIVIQTKVKPADLDLLVKAAVGVVTRREMSLNRRLWAWLLGPEPTVTEGDQGVEQPMSPTDVQSPAYITSRTKYFEEFGLRPLTRTLLQMIKNNYKSNAADQARPYRVCLSLMDRWEIGGLVVAEVFLPIIESVRDFQNRAATKEEFTEVLRSASVFFDGIESGLIYGEIVGLLAQSIGPGNLSATERSDKLALASFILANFNVREEEMVTIHAPLCCLATLSMLEDSLDHRNATTSSDFSVATVSSQALSVAISLLDLIPERAFPEKDASENEKASEDDQLAIPNVEILKKIRTFYVHEQGNIDVSPPPFNALRVGELILHKAVKLICNDGQSPADLGVRIRLFGQALHKTPIEYRLADKRLLGFLREKLNQQDILLFSDFSAMLQLSTQLSSADRIETQDLSSLVVPLVRHAWSYLSAAEPKYHVEAVRGLWQLQSILSPTNRDIEAALSTLIISKDLQRDTFPTADKGRAFSVLWSHTLQDNAHGMERRGSRTPMLDFKMYPRLSGTEYYDVMLTQPLFLILDTLQDDTCRLYMTVKSWLNTMFGIDRLFLIFVSKLGEIPFLHDVGDKAHDLEGDSATVNEDEDLELCLYYLRTLSNILACAGDISWNVLASKHVSFEGNRLHISSGGDDELNLQDFFIRLCIKCISIRSTSPDMDDRLNQLYRYALMILHKFFLSPFVSALSDMHLENILIKQLVESLGRSDPYVQVLLLDVVQDALKLKAAIPADLPSPVSEKKSMNFESGRQHSLSLATNDPRPVIPPPPPQLIKCIQDGLSSPSSRPVLDSWIGFIAECLPFYYESIFQVVIPLVETLCKEIGTTFASLKDTFVAGSSLDRSKNVPESTLIYLLNGLEQVLAQAHDQLLAEEARAPITKSPDQPQSIFGSMVSGVWQSDAPQSRTATANNRLTVHLAFQDAVRMCYQIWSWGQGDDSARQDQTSSASFNYTSMRMRNRARRLLEHLFTAENLECLETSIHIWKDSVAEAKHSEVFHLLSALEASRPRHAIPALFNAIYSRTNPSALDPARKSTMTISLQDIDLVVFLVEYTRTLEDDAMDEIWQDCMTFLKDLLGNPFPHRQTLPNLLEFAAILGEKVDNTNFGEQKKMRRELGDIFLRLLAALFTTRPMAFADPPPSAMALETPTRASLIRRTTLSGASDAPDGVVFILASVAPSLPKILIESDRVLSAANTISTNVVGPALRAKGFPETITKSMLQLLQELSRIPKNQKTWKKDVGDAFNDARFFGMSRALVRDDWLPLLRQWTLTDKERMPEIIARINAPTTAGIVFGVGATSARLEADRKTQLNLRRIATLVLASAEDAFVADLPAIFDKLVELLAATSTSSPSSVTRADIYMVVRALALKTSAIHLGMLWPVVNAEMHAAMSSVAAPNSSAASETYTNAAVLQACKLLDLLICVAPDDFQLHEWLFITDTIEAVYRSPTYQPVALADELSEELGAAAAPSSAQQQHAESVANLVATGTGTHLRRPLLGAGGGAGISDEVGLERRDELVARVLRPFFGQLSIFAFESTYAMGRLDQETCEAGLLRDVFDERSIVRAL